MPDTTTPHFALVLIQIGASRDSWGTKINANMAAIDTALDQLRNTLGAKLNSATYTDAGVLEKLKAVDGAGSGLDADLLDGQQGEFYAPASAVTATALLTAIKTVDGAGSGLDADTLDGKSADGFAASDHVHNDYLKQAGGALTGALTRQGEGVFPHFAAAGMTGGKVYLAPADGADPTSGLPGEIWLGYA